MYYKYLTTLKKKKKKEKETNSLKREPVSINAMQNIWGKGAERELQFSH